jgi:hypothetical protein
MTARRRSNRRTSNQIERRVQCLDNDKTCLGVIEPLANGRWRAVKSGREIGTYPTIGWRLQAVGGSSARGGRHRCYYSWRDGGVHVAG